MRICQNCGCTIPDSPLCSVCGAWSGAIQYQEWARPPVPWAEILSVLERIATALEAKEK